MDIVNKLLEAFKSLKGSAKEGGSKKGRGLALAGIIGSIAMIIIGILSFRAWKTGKKMAKLLHEKAVTEEKAVQAVTDVQLANNEEERKVAQAEIDKIREKLAGIAEAMQEAEQTFDQAKETIHEIRNWDELDRFRG